MFREYFLVCAGEASAVATSVVADCVPLKIQQGPANDLKLGLPVHRQLAGTVKGTGMYKQLCPGNEYLKFKYVDDDKNAKRYAH